MSVCGFVHLCVFMHACMGVCAGRTRLRRECVYVTDGAALLNVTPPPPFPAAQGESKLRSGELGLEVVRRGSLVWRETARPNPNANRDMKDVLWRLSPTTLSPMWPTEGTNPDFYIVYLAFRHSKPPLILCRWKAKGDS